MLPPWRKEALLLLCFVLVSFVQADPFYPAIQTIDNTLVLITPRGTNVSVSYVENATGDLSPPEPLVTKAQLEALLEERLGALRTEFYLNVSAIYALLSSQATNTVEVERLRAMATETSLAAALGVVASSATNAVDLEASRSNSAAQSISAAIAAVIVSSTTRSGSDLSAAIAQEASLAASIDASRLQLTNSVLTEASRATVAEAAISTSVGAASASLASSVGDERTRAVAKENSLAQALTAATTSLASSVSDERTRALGVEGSLTSSLSGNVASVLLNQASLSNSIGNTIATSASLANSVGSEASRAVRMEGSVTTSLLTSINSVSGTVSALSSAVGSSLSGLSTTDVTLAAQINVMNNALVASINSVSGAVGTRLSGLSAADVSLFAADVSLAASITATLGAVAAEASRAVRMEGSVMTSLVTIVNSVSGTVSALSSAVGSSVSGLSATSASLASSITATSNTLATSIATEASRAVRVEGSITTFIAVGATALYAASSASVLFAMGATAGSVYWVLVNGYPTQVTYRTYNGLGFGIRTTPSDFATFAYNWRFSGPVVAIGSAPTSFPAEMTTFNYASIERGWGYVRIDTDYITGISSQCWYVRKKFYITGGFSYSGQVDDDEAWSLTNTANSPTACGGNIADRDGGGGGTWTGRAVTVSTPAVYLFAGRGCDGAAGEEYLMITAITAGMSNFYEVLAE